jgi:hypothetical protein
MILRWMSSATVFDKRSFSMMGMGRMSQFGLNQNYDTIIV